jgi:hypothetical protein
MILIILDAQTNRSPHRIAVDDAAALFEVAWALSETKRKYKVWDGLYRSPDYYTLGDLSGWFVPEQKSAL